MSKLNRFIVFVFLQMCVYLLSYSIYNRHWLSIPACRTADAGIMYEPLIIWLFLLEYRWRTCITRNDLGLVSIPTQPIISISGYIYDQFWSCLFNQVFLELSAALLFFFYFTEVYCYKETKTQNNKKQTKWQAIGTAR